MNKSVTEQAIVNAIIEYIRLLGGVAIRVNSGMRLIQSADGSTRAFRGAAKGTADVIACLDGRPLAIEVKTLRGRVRPEQETFLAAWRTAGGIGFIARSVDDVIERIGG